MLECSVIDLNALECPSLSVNFYTQKCQNHSTGKNNFNKHCAKQKTIFFFKWLTNERGIDKNGGTGFNNLCLDYGGQESESFSFRGRNKKSGNQFSHRKVKLLPTEDKIRSFTHIVYYIEHFLHWRKQKVKISTQSLSSGTHTDVEAPGWCRKRQKTNIHCQKRCNTW